MPGLFPLIRRFGRDRRGNIAVIFAIACVPLIAAFGCAVDYARVAQIKTKLQSAVDAASLGAIARTSPAFIVALRMGSDGAIPAGQQDAINLFNANIVGMSGLKLNSLRPVVLRSGNTLTSTVTFNATVAAFFLGIIGASTVAVTGSSNAIVTLPDWSRRPSPGGQFAFDPRSRRMDPGTATRWTNSLSPALISQPPAGVTMQRNP